MVLVHALIVLAAALLAAVFLANRQWDWYLMKKYFVSRYL